jgi:hypothetical protein
MFASPWPWADARTLLRVLLYGSPATRRAAALRLLAAREIAWWTMLSDTMRLDEDWRVRARALEILGLAAGEADRPEAEAILTAVTQLARDLP